MALLYMDGFDAADTALRWVQPGSVPADYTFATPTRFGTGKALTISATVNFGNPSIFRACTPSSTIYVGAAVQLGLEMDAGGSLPTANAFGVYTDGGTTGHLYLRRVASNSLLLYRGDANNGMQSSPSGTQIAQSPVGTIDGNWHYVEMSATIHDSTGRVIVKVDGNTVIDFTGDTRNGGTSMNIDAVRFRTGKFNNFGSNCIISIDDLYICDGTGTTNNTFLGDVRVQTILPTGAGSSTQLAPTGAANNWQNVNEVPFNSATYNASSTVGQKDLYALGDLTAGTTSVFATQSVAHMHKSDAGAGTAKVAIKSGASTYYEATQSLGTVPNGYTAIRQTDPATSLPWTVSGVNAIEAGVEIA